MNNEIEVINLMLDDCSNVFEDGEPEFGVCKILYKFSTTY